MVEHSEYAARAMEALVKSIDEWKPEAIAGMAFDIADAMWNEQLERQEFGVTTSTTTTQGMD